MSPTFPSIWRGAALLVLFLNIARAQWYAPETNYHDPVQRVFPVELARVLAWRENLAGASIKEVTYTVGTEADGATRWTLRWIDTTGQTWREATVTYPEDQLCAGPTFYRDVLHQLSAQAWTAALAPSAAELGTAFWTGLGEMGASRMATLRDAIATGASLSAPDSGHTSARLAGQLLAAAVPGVGGMLTLDSTLAARGAAWLVLSEPREATPDASADRRWAVVLWLARRENAATELWARTGASPADTPAGKKAQAWWDVVLRPSNARALFVRAADYDDPVWAMPLLVYAARLRNYVPLAATCAALIADNNEERLLPAHDYAAWIYEKGNVESGHVTNGRWVAEARRDWLTTFRLLQKEPPETNAWVTALDRALENREANPREVVDPALAGFAAAADLINRGYREGAGPLEPVAVVTARDLLNFGWEISGTQLAGRFGFLDHKYGDKSVSQPFRQAVAAAPALDSFFAPTTATASANSTPPPYARWQRIEAGGSIVIRGPAPAQQSDRAQLLAARSWLMVDHLTSVLGGILSARYYPKAEALLLRIHAEGGPLTDRDLLGHLLPPVTSVAAARARNATRQTPPPKPALDRAALLARLAERLPSDGALGRRIRFSELNALPLLERARAYERLFWRDPDAHDFATAFNWYLEAGAFASAKRYYDCIAPLFGGSVGFSNTVGPRRTMLALLEGDLSTAQRVLAANETGSMADLTAELMLAAVKHDRAQVERIARDANERYPNKNPAALMPKMLGFIPLWPALDTPGHPDRERALDYFAQSEVWPSFQWFIAQQAKLSREETIRFLGGDQAQGERQMMIAYLRDDRETFTRCYEEMIAGTAPRRWGTMAFVLAQWLRADLFKTAAPPDDPTLSPVNPRTIEQEVRDARTQRSNQRLTARLAAFDTADKLWAHLQSLLAPPAEANRADMPQRFRELNATARLFAERYPQDERSWSARVLRAKFAPTIARFEGSAPDEEAMRREWSAIATASAAPRRMRFDATFTLLQLDFQRVQASPDPVARRELAARTAAAQREFSGEPRADAFDLLTGELLMPIDASAATAAWQRASASTIPAIAEEARRQLRRQEVFSKPFELKFTALDGREVDFTKLRGQVVLLDFWATWCPPCVAEMPQLVQLYKTYQPQGLEIVGISLDQNQAALTAFLQKNGMGWPQYFDGRGWANQLSAPWGITSIPTKWIVDRTGHVTPLASDADLEAEVKQRLAPPAPVTVSTAP